MSSLRSDPPSTMHNRRPDTSYFGATAPFSDQEHPYDSPPTTTPMTMNALFPVTSVSTETNASTAATRPSRPLSNSHVITPRVAVHHQLQHTRPHQAPVSVGADDSNGPSLVSKLQQIGFWNIVIVVVTTIVTLIVVAVVVSNRSDTSKSLPTVTSNRSPTLAPILVRPRYSPTRAPVSARPVFVSDTAQIVPSTIFPGTDGGCSYGDALAGSSDYYDAQRIPFNESGLNFIINGEAVTEVTTESSVNNWGTANVTLHIGTTYQFAVVSHTTPFVAALIRVSQTLGGTFTFGPWVENPYDSNADSQLGNECNTNVWGITDLGLGTTPSVTGRFVSESVGEYSDWNLVQVDVVVLLTNTMPGDVSYTYKQYTLNSTLVPVTETQPAEVGFDFLGAQGCATGTASGDRSEWNMTEVLPLESRVAFTINGRAVSVDRNVTLETRGNYDFAVVTLDGAPAFARALIRVSQGDSDNTFTFAPRASAVTDDIPVDSQVASACLPPAAGVTDLETGNATSVTGRFISQSTSDLVVVDVTVIWINALEETLSYAYDQFQLSTRLPTRIPVATASTIPTSTP